ncbi:MAG: hypothetical protein IKR92_01710 [Alphaproteobacteria bacterium]|nr:hypothetical protein [Alphaproteobacteria bacterium]
MKSVCKIILWSCLFVGIMSSLSACGRFSQPYPVEGSGYPHNYPRH